MIEQRDKGVGVGDAAPGATLRLPKAARGPGASLARRLVIALGLVVFVAGVAYADRNGYRDAAGGTVGILDAFYYATVSITTTGYGDIIPVTDRSRLLTTLLVTPARILFLILLVGTTLEVLAETSRAAVREKIWRKKLRDHVIVCGYGTKGRSAIEVLQAHGRKPADFLVIDAAPDRVEEASRNGFATLHGDASRASVLEAASIRAASVVIVASDRDDTAVLITLTAREHNPGAAIIAAVREQENRHLLLQSGANSVITSSEAAGRLLGFAAFSPDVVEILEDMLSVGTGLDVVERAVENGDVGRSLAELPATAPVLAVARDGELLRFDDSRIGILREEDRLICLCANAA